ncbi:SDR family NAD(P)-dependent oxidoreductase [Rhodococcus kroppenstedtii]|uniref:SDR family NAD(P)-dependent oxidoreductase n=1 Tax=Rhodococcoides kroppenstedtii TaxID=293050 RepID=UPI0029559083|nr:SDR family NAD(P)-dependent oxidoreductase [Rhodococcus kroppenstedtii]MDV7199115.1 SDR family NAD(P)-dependent oxidoreductase [Rhodococcus kroppenstedtii]
MDVWGAVTGTYRRGAARFDRAGLQRPRPVSELIARGHPLAGSTVLVTGASSGIGAAAARRFGEEGATVLLVARSAEPLEEVRREIVDAGGAAVALTADLADEDDAARLIEKVLAEFGAPDVVINNAGRSIRRRMLDSTDRLHDYRRTAAINYFAPVQLTLGFAPAMVERGSGHFVNVSTWGVPGGAMPKFSAYAGSKSALSMFGRSIAIELARTGVGVTTVYFPLIRTPMIEPTARYRDVPTLSADDAGEWLVDAARYRPAEMLPRYTRTLRRIGAARVEWADRLTAMAHL